MFLYFRHMQSIIRVSANPNPNPNPNKNAQYIARIQKPYFWFRIPLQYFSGKIHNRTPFKNPSRIPDFSLHIPLRLTQPV